MRSSIIYYHKFETMNKLVLLLLLSLFYLSTARDIGDESYHEEPNYRDDENIDDYFD